MRRRIVLLAALAALAGPLDSRDLLAARDGWAAFRDDPGQGCRAVTRAVAWSRGGGAPHLDILARPGRARGQVHLWLSRAATAATLDVAGRRTALTVRGRDAWTANAATDDAVLALVRGGGVLTVEGVANGRPFRDVYRLAGAATAIDAARLGCPG